MKRCFYDIFMRKKYSRRFNIFAPIMLINNNIYFEFKAAFILKCYKDFLCVNLRSLIIIFLKLYPYSKVPDHSIPHNLIHHLILIFNSVSHINTSGGTILSNLFPYTEYSIFPSYRLEENRTRLERGIIVRVHARIWSRRLFLI